MTGFETAFKGRPLSGLPDPLIAAMGRHHVGSVALSLPGRRCRDRQGAANHRRRKGPRANAAGIHHHSR
ncbi:MAG: hypothetical protein WDN28_02930 [Chthoniobacter sp.]